MKKILITLIVYLLSSNVSIANESDCSGIKKLSKEYLTCKAKNIKGNIKCKSFKFCIIWQCKSKR